MKMLAIPIVVFLFAILAGCGGSGISVSQDFDPGFDFSGFKTFTVAPYESKMGMDQITYGEIKDAVTKNLTAKGMSVSDSNPDFIVSTAAAQQQQTDVYNEGIGWGDDVYQYEEGTLLVDFFEAKGQKLVWRGKAKGALDDNPDQQKKIDIINETIAQLLEKFPPKS